MGSSKKRYLSEDWQHIDMSANTIDAQIEQKRKEIRELRNKETMFAIQGALAKGDAKALLVACSSFVSRNRVKGQGDSNKRNGVVQHS